MEMWGRWTESNRRRQPFQSWKLTATSFVVFSELLDERSPDISVRLSATSTYSTQGFVRVARDTTRAASRFRTGVECSFAHFDTGKKKGMQSTESPTESAKSYFLSVAVQF